MERYIDAYKLIAELNRQKRELKLSIQSQGDYGQSCQIAAYENFLSLIFSLQQEQPKVDLVAELKHHIATTPKEQLEKEWKELEPWGNIGPTVQEFLYGKQSEVDLEKEINEWLKNGHITDTRYSDYCDDDIKETARHFYELGLKAIKGE